MTVLLLRHRRYVGRLHWQRAHRTLRRDNTSTQPFVPCHDIREGRLHDLALVSTAVGAHAIRAAARKDGKNGHGGSLVILGEVAALEPVRLGRELHEIAWRDGGDAEGDCGHDHVRALFTTAVMPIFNRYASDAVKGNFNTEVSSTRRDCNVYGAMERIHMHLEVRDRRPAWSESAPPRPPQQRVDRNSV
ncbi:hypothetical protein BC830DRAFT_1126900 [Chytriomyces sp. MP71]|nr:hypothetical protein BC830DRAFT_1126900 [Chytriomyces sp. MP71]